MYSCAQTDVFCTWTDTFCDRTDTFCARTDSCCARMIHVCFHCPSSIMYCVFLLPCPLLCQSETSVLFRHLSRAVCACIHSCHSVAPSLLYHFIPICVFCKCLSLAFASSIVSVSSLIQALSFILYIAFYGATCITIFDV